MSKHGMFVLMVVCLLVQLASSQSKSKVSTQNGQPTLVADKLKQHNIPITNEALVEALGNPDAEVRGLAAVQLADLGVRSAIPSIISAATNETVPIARINIALALSWLGEQKGFDLLKTTCNNPDLGGHIRAAAASYLLDLNDNSCLGAMLTVLQNDADPDSLMGALALLPRFTNVSQADFSNMVAVNRRALTNSTPAVRIVASHTLVALGSSDTVPDLERAVADERDQVVLTRMKADLQRLHDKTGH